MAPSTCTRRAAMRAITRRASNPRHLPPIHPIKHQKKHLTTSPKTTQASPPPRPKPLPFKPTSPKPPPPNPTPIDTSAPQPVADLVRNRFIGIFGAGAAALCLGAFAASLYMANRTEAPTYTYGQEPVAPTGRPSIQSPLEFDSHLDKSEWRLGITKLRRRVAAEATGHVLEVAMGTGRNMEFYGWGRMTEGMGDDEEGRKKKMAERNREKLEKTGWGRGGRVADLVEMESFTGVDISPPMLDISLKRIRQFVPHTTDAIPRKPKFRKLSQKLNDTDTDPNPIEGLALLEGKLRILKADTQASLPPPPPETKQSHYDTIIQTFGLCSVRDPTRLLRNMAAVVRPGTGRILLVEHGRGWWDVVNGMLDRSARGHFERFGCWWNRDMERIVEDAVAEVPGLEVVEFRRPGWITLGTHVFVELRVREHVSKATGKEGRQGGGKGSDGNNGSVGWSMWSIFAPRSKPAADDEPKKGQ